MNCTQSYDAQLIKSQILANKMTFILSVLFSDSQSDFWSNHALEATCLWVPTSATAIVPLESFIVINNLYLFNVDIVSNTLYIHYIKHYIK